MEQIFEEMKAARVEHNRIKRTIEDWMGEEAKKGIFTYASNHPDWPKYEVALTAWQKALTRFDTVLETNTVS